jgi:hypothetical protein
MPALTFPAFVPSSRSYNPGVYPQSEFKALNGATTILRYGNRTNMAEMTLGYSHLTDDQVAWFLDVYDQQNTWYDYWINLTTADALGGTTGSLLTHYAKTVTGHRWRFLEPPSVESTFKGRSNVRVRLGAYLDA